MNENHPTRHRILEAAVKVAEEQGFTTLRRDQVAAAANVAPTLVTHYYGDMTALRAAVMREAIRLCVYKVIVQGLAVDDITARTECPQAVKQQAAALIAR